MSPILVRPVREQLEHDRIIRLLTGQEPPPLRCGHQPRRRAERAVGTGPSALYPDLVLSSLERGRRLQAVVEVETGESVNHLEALAEWAHLAHVRAAFHLYVPSSMVDVARRLAEENQIHVNEIWSYHAIGDEVRFTLVHRSRDAPCSRARAGRLAAGVAAAPSAPKKPGPCQGAACIDRRPRPRVKAVKKKTGARRTESSGAIPQVLARQARLRALLPRPGRRTGAAMPRAAHPVLVSHAAWRQSRPRAVRRRPAPRARGAESRRRSSTGSESSRRRCRRPRRRTLARAPARRARRET